MQICANNMLFFFYLSTLAFLKKKAKQADDQQFSLVRGQGPKGSRLLLSRGLRLIPELPRRGGAAGGGDSKGRRPLQPAGGSRHIPAGGPGPRQGGLMAVQLPPQDVRAGGGGGRSAEGRGRESPHNLACKEEGPLLRTRSLYCSQTGCTGRRCPPLPSRPPGRRRDSWAPSSCRIQMTSPFLPGLGIDISWHSPRKLLAVSPPARRPPAPQPPGRRQYLGREPAAPPSPGCRLQMG